MSIMATTFLVVRSSTVSLSVSSQLSNEGHSFQCRINTVYQGMKLAHKKTDKHARIKLVTTYFLRAETPVQNWVSRKLRPKTRKTFCLYTISVPLNTATCTKSMYLLPFHLFRGSSIPSRGNMIFLSAYLKCCVKKSVQAALQVYLSKCLPEL